MQDQAGRSTVRALLSKNIVTAFRAVQSFAEKISAEFLAPWDLHSE